jgi:hypothetical protein
LGIYYTYCTCSRHILDYACMGRGGARERC